MGGSENDFRFGFVYEFDEMAQWHAESSGVLSHVWVELSDGQKYPVEFCTVDYIKDLVDPKADPKEPIYATPGTIVVPDVTMEWMTKAVQILTKGRFFSYIRPLKPESEWRPGWWPP